jgi:transposase-like protein
MVKKGRKTTKGAPFKYEVSFMRHVVADYLQGGESIRQVAGRYNVNRQSIIDWKKRFYSDIADTNNIEIMTESEQKELEALKKQMKALQKQLDYEKLRNFALETMMDLAKEKLGVDVRKNFGAKQPEP